MMETNAKVKGFLRPAAERPADSSRWLTTFNDMITLLMVFFVLLFSMGSLDVERFKHFQNALQSAMGLLDAGLHAPVGIVTDPPSFPGQEADAGQGAWSSGSDPAPAIDTRGLEAVYTPDGIHLTLDDKLLFGSGSARLTTGGEALLDRVARIIKPLKRTIRVEGHTDNRPIATSVYPSNWELSTARAVSVVKYLIQSAGIQPQYLAAAGYGESKPRAPNDSERNMSKNRRVEIILGDFAEFPDVEQGFRK
jgi:chemotaxis protein MotB